MEAKPSKARLTGVTQICAYTKCITHFEPFPASKCVTPLEPFLLPDVYHVWNTSRHTISTQNHHTRAATNDASKKRIASECALCRADVRIIHAVWRLRRDSELSVVPSALPCWLRLDLTQPR